MSELENPIDELFRRTKLTTKIRYRASERLKRHYRLSRWTITILTCSLIFIPLTQAFNVQVPVTQGLLNVWQAVLAILVLVYAIHLGDENFDLRSYKMHCNGVELGRFARKLAGLRSSDVERIEYEKLANEYYAILEKYENHEPIDYQVTLLSEFEERGRHWFRYSLMFVKVGAFRALLFSHYLISVLASFGVIYFYFS